MIEGCGRFAALTAALLLSAAAAAGAEPIETTAALTVNALTGQHHVDSGRTDRLSFAPLPLSEITIRGGAEEIRLEGLPPVTFGYANGGDGTETTQLSIINATYRHTFRGGWFVGVGQTLYNQYTTYPSRNDAFYQRHGSPSESINGHAAQYSRVTGARFEIGKALQLRRDRVEVSAAANPRMRGIQYTRVPTFMFICPMTGGSASCRQRIDTFADPENAAQIDVFARIARRISKRSELLYGFRYINYTAHYDDFPAQLADRNVGFAPVLGYRLKF